MGARLLWALAAVRAYEPGSIVRDQRSLNRAPVRGRLRDVVVSGQGDCDSSTVSSGRRGAAGQHRQLSQGGPAGWGGRRREGKGGGAHRWCSAARTYVRSAGGGPQKSICLYLFLNVFFFFPGNLRSLVKLELLLCVVDIS